MPTSTKIVLALIVVLLVVLGLYYGLVGGATEPLSATGATGARDVSEPGRVESHSRADADELIPTERSRSERGLLPGSMRDLTSRSSRPAVPEGDDYAPPVAGSDSRSGDSSVDRADPRFADPDHDDIELLVGPQRDESLADDLPDVNLGDMIASGGKDGDPHDRASGDAQDSDARSDDGRRGASPQRRPAIAPPPQHVEYTVRENDNLWTIAAEWFGDGSKWDLIAKANPSIDPQHLKIGMVLRLPPRDAERDEDDAMQGVTPPGVVGVEYTVRSGDTLSRIARMYYGNAARWPLIFEANRRTIGDRPENLRVGMKLTIPPAPAERRTSGAEE